MNNIIEQHDISIDFPAYYFIATLSSEIQIANNFPFLFGKIHKNPKYPENIQSGSKNESRIPEKFNKGCFFPGSAVI